MRALNAFIADIYGERRSSPRVIVPGRLIEADWYEPAMRGLLDPPGDRRRLAGPDLVRAPDGGSACSRTTCGRLRVCLPARAREVVAAAPCGLGAATLEPALAPGAAIRGAAPDGVGDPFVVLLNDGPQTAPATSTEACARLGMTIVGAGDLDPRAGRLMRAGDTRPST